jgi:cobalamin-dependent methionine synthase I
MIIIGEKINSSIPATKAAMEARDVQALVKLAKDQYNAGAAFVEINAGMFLEKESELLAFVAGALKEALDIPLSIDTPSPAAAAAALKVLGAGRHIINSVTAEPKRLEAVSALAAEYGCGVVALCMRAPGKPPGTESILKTADILVGYLTRRGIKSSDIYLDPMLRPLGADGKAGVDALENIRRLRALYPECHITVGLSNISYGLPMRHTVNRAFAVAAMYAGLDAAIADPLDRKLMGLISATEAILGRDEFCLDFIGGFRDGKIG